MSNSIIKILKNEEETLALGAKLANSFHSDGHCLIHLYGNLGAGKTTFVRGFMRGLGYEGKVKSPTYTLVESYDIANIKIFHFDLYRLQTPNELELIGISDYFQQQAIILIEWPEKALQVLPKPDIACHLKIHDDGREMQLDGNSKIGEMILSQLK